MFTVAVGFTVIVKVINGPIQNDGLFINCGNTVIVAVTGVNPLLVATNDGIFPKPLAAMPIEGLLLTQL